MTYQQLIDGLKRFGSTEEDICKSTIGVYSSQIHEQVILAPWWEPEILPKVGNAIFVSDSADAAKKVWEIQYGEKKLTYIKTGIGAPVLIDIVLALGLTKCREVIFIGSVGALSSEIGIGDIVIPEWSICGDGASRYIKNESLKGKDIFGEKAYPNEKLLARTKAVANKICAAHNVKWHNGYTFSVDTIFAQFAHMDEIMDMGCNTIEMETAAAFQAAVLAKIAITAIFSVSDNIVAKKSLVSGRTPEEMAYRSFVRSNLFPEIVHNIFD